MRRAWSNFLNHHNFLQYQNEALHYIQYNMAVMNRTELNFSVREEKRRTCKGDQFPSERRHGDQDWFAVEEEAAL